MTFAEVELIRDESMRDSLFLTNGVNLEKVLLEASEHA